MHMYVCVYMKGYKMSKSNQLGKISLFFQGGGHSFKALIL